MLKWSRWCPWLRMVYPSECLVDSLGLRLDFSFAQSSPKAVSMQMVAVKSQMCWLMHRQPGTEPFCLVKVAEDWATSRMKEATQNC